MINLIIASISSSSSRGENAKNDLSLIPIGFDNPFIWYSSDSVELDAFGGITKYINKGSSGPVNDATSLTSNLATVGELNGRPISLLPSGASSGGYLITGTPNANLVMGLATYKDGIDSLFDNYDGYMSGALQMTGNLNTANWFTAQPISPFKNGIPTSSVVLPCLESTIGALSTETNGQSINRIFCDDFNTSRNWKGMSGDFIAFDNRVFVADDMLTLHNQYVSYYGL